MCADIYIIDGKKSDLYSLRHVLGNDKVFASPTEAAKLLRVMDNNMVLRYEHFNGHFGQDLSSYIVGEKVIRPVVIVIDELAILLNSKARKDIEDHLFNLLTGGRQSLIFVVVGIARPSSDIVSRNTTLNFNTRILLNSNAADTDSKRMMFPMTDVKTLPMTDGSKGSGVIYEEGMGWLVPRPINFPNIYSIDIPEILQRIQKEINPNWFIKENYWITV